MQYSKRIKIFAVLFSFFFFSLVLKPWQYYLYMENFNTSSNKWVEHNFSRIIENGANTNCTANQKIKSHMRHYMTFFSNVMHIPKNSTYYKTYLRLWDFEQRYINRRWFKQNISNNSVGWEEGGPKWGSHPLIILTH